MKAMKLNCLLRSFSAVVVTAMSFSIRPVHAETWTDASGRRWNYEITDGKATLNHVNDAEEDVVIPSSINGVPVTSIQGIMDYQERPKLTSVTIPNSVTSIGNGAFACCSGLTSVTIPNSVTSIGGFAFACCSGLTSMTIPNSVTNIGGSAFFCCTGLTSVTIPNSVTSIESSAFWGCSGLTSVKIPDSVTSIGQGAFENCSSLRSVTIPDSVTTLGSSAFDGCAFMVDWYKTLVNTAAGSVDSGHAYSLTKNAGDRAIADVTVNGDTALDAFVLEDGKVYDSILYIRNSANRAVKVTLPKGHTYQAFRGAAPLTLPAQSQSILTITRVAGGSSGGNVFLVTREELETIR